MRLSRITGLEREKIIAEHAEILLTIADLKDILAKPARVAAIAREEFVELRESHGDQRRTEITTDAGDVNLEALVTPADVFVTFSQNGYIKRVLQDEFRSQHRAGKGKTGAALKDSDFVRFTLRAHTHDHILMFSNFGKVYCFKVFELPEAAANARGKSIAQILTLQSGEQITAMLPVTEFSENMFVFMCTSQGTVKKTELSAFSNIRATGLRAVNLDEGDALVSVRITSGKNQMILTTANGRAIRFNEDEVRSMGRTARGVTGINMDDSDTVVAAEVVDPSAQEKLLVVTEFGYGKRSELEEYRLTGRAGKGVNAIRVTERNGKVVALLSVPDSADLMMTTNTGRVLRIHTKSVKVIGRLTQGVCLMRILDGERIVSVSKPNEFDDTPVTQLDVAEEIE
jgi:DNA gyrase subunit A